MCPWVSQYMCQCLFQHRSLCACHITWNCASTSVSVYPIVQAPVPVSNICQCLTPVKRVRACLNTCNSACHSARASASPSTCASNCISTWAALPVPVKCQCLTYYTWHFLSRYIWKCLYQYMSQCLSQFVSACPSTCYSDCPSNCVWKCQSQPGTDPVSVPVIVSGFVSFSAWQGTCLRAFNCIW